MGEGLPTADAVEVSIVLVVKLGAAVSVGDTDAAGETLSVAREEVVGCMEGRAVRVKEELGVASSGLGEAVEVVGAVGEGSRGEKEAREECVRAVLDVGEADAAVEADA